MYNCITECILEWTSWWFNIFRCILGYNLISRLAEKDEGEWWQAACWVILTEQMRVKTQKDQMRKSDKWDKQTMRKNRKTENCRQNVIMTEETTHHKESEMFSYSTRFAFLWSEWVLIIIWEHKPVTSDKDQLSKSPNTHLFYQNKVSHSTALPWSSLLPVQHIVPSVKSCFNGRLQQLG